MKLSKNIWDNLNYKNKLEYLLENNLATENNFLLHMLNYSDLINELNKGKK